MPDRAAGMSEATMPMEKKLNIQEVSARPYYVSVSIVKDNIRKNNLIINLPTVIAFAAFQNGCRINNKGQFVDPEAFAMFLSKDGLRYFYELRDRRVSIDWNQLIGFVSQYTRQDRKQVSQSLERFIYSTSFSFEEIAVSNEQLMLQNYFSLPNSNADGISWRVHTGKYVTDPRFIALLIDLNYTVAYGDLVPILQIDPKGPLSRP